MRCVNCGFENKEGSRFCVSCGKPLEEEGARPKLGVLDSEGGAGVDQPSAFGAPLPQEGQVGRKGGAGDVVADLVGKVKGLDKRVLAVAGGIAAMAIVAVVVLVVVLGGGPGERKFRDDVMAAGLSWGYGDDTYGGGDFKIESIENVQSSKEDMPALYQAYLGNEMYKFTAHVTASDGYVEAESTVEAYYSKPNGEWTLVSGPNVTGESTYHAVKAPSKKKIAAKADAILSAASRDLADIYDGAKVTVDDPKLSEDGQSCTVKLVYKESNTFSEATANVEATFVVKDGSWVLDSATADDDAKKVSYEKLVGTWKGTFSSLNSGGSSGNCYGAQKKELTITIKSVDPDSLKVEGTFSGLAHFHDPLESDSNSTDGDQMVSDQSFVATLEGGHHVTTGGWYGISCDIGAEAKTPEDSRGYLLLSFGFGTEDDSNAAQVTLETSSTYKSGFGTWSANFYDTYTLTKVE